MIGVRGWCLLWLAMDLSACGSSPAMPDASGAIDASADAAAAGALTLTSDFDDFGTVSIGVTSAPITVTATNTGGQPTGSLVATFQPSTTQFEIGADTCTGTTLAPGTSCTLQVRFMPIGPGIMDAIVHVEDGTVSGTRQLRGSAVFGHDINSVNPSAHDFGDVLLGMSSTFGTFTVTNNGGTTHGPSTMTLTGPDLSAFAVVANNCSSGPLAAGASCTFGVTFTPQASGIATAYVQMTATPGGHNVVALRGNGLDPALRIDLPSLHFGSVPLGGRSEYARFEVSNVSAATTAPLTAVIAGMHPNDFTIAVATNTCETVALAPGASCSVEVRFEPTTVQSRYARLTVAASSSSAVAALAGDAGNANSLEIKPTPVSFGDVPVGQASAAHHFTITNHATAASLPITVSSTSSVFQISNNTCSNVMLAQSASCAFDVTAHPTAAGLVAGSAGSFVHSGLIVRGVP